MTSFVSHLEGAIDGTRLEPGRLWNTHNDRPILVRYDLPAVARAINPSSIRARPPSLWRYRELLPLPLDVKPVTLGEGMTPLLPCPRLGPALGVPNLWIKDESQLPTGSFKSRGMAVAVSMAKHLGVKSLALPTAGNAGGAAAAYAARAEMPCYIFMPADTPAVNQMEAVLYGAKAFRVNGLIDDCGKLVKAGQPAIGWFDLSTLKEPYRLEGKKTMGLELAAQFGWELPDAIFYPTGGGTGLIGMWKAFAELEALGWIGAKRPKMFAVQASGCAPMVKAFEEGKEHAERWENANTIASGIRVPRAVGDFLILRAVRESGGIAMAVDDPAIEAAVEACAREDGLLLCPEGGATLAAYHQARAQGLVSAGDRVVLFNCATGLKYPMPDRSKTLDRHAAIDLAAL